MHRPPTFRLSWALAALATVVLPSSAVQAAKGTPLPPGAPAYLHDTSTNYSQPEWMSRLSDSIPLNRISMVGTHDSGAFYGGDIVQTQSLPLRAQLDMGVRSLDLRCKHIDNGLRVYHGIIDQKMACRDFVAVVVRFVREHPSETVILRVQEEGRGERNTNSFDDAFNTEIYSYAYPKEASSTASSAQDSPFYQGTDIPTLGKVRGKIYILQNFAGRPFGRRYVGGLLDPSWTMNTNWDLYDKWERVKRDLDKTMSGNIINEFYVNSLNASVGSFPYFVVSGKSSPGTNAPRLATGFTTPGWSSKYPDFPRVNCVLGICTIAFEGTNPLAERYIRERTSLKKEPKDRFVGILSTDFPGPSLVDAVINVNALQK